MNLKDIKKKYKGAPLHDLRCGINMELAADEYLRLKGQTLDEKAKALYNELNTNNMEQKFEITKEAILKGAETCPTVKNALRAMFPQAFEKNIVQAYYSYDVQDGRNIFYLNGEAANRAMNYGNRKVIMEQLTLLTNEILNK